MSIIINRFAINDKLQNTFYFVFCFSLSIPNNKHTNTTHTHIYTSPLVEGRVTKFVGVFHMLKRADPHQIILMKVFCQKQTLQVIYYTRKGWELSSNRPS